MADIRVPTLALAAGDDPWIPEALYRGYDWEGNKALVPLLPQHKDERLANDRAWAVLEGFKRQAEVVNRQLAELLPDTFRSFANQSSYKSLPRMKCR